MVYVLMSMAGFQLLKNHLIKTSAETVKAHGLNPWGVSYPVRIHSLRSPEIQCNRCEMYSSGTTKS